MPINEEKLKKLKEAIALAIGIAEAQCTDNSIIAKATVDKSTNKIMISGSRAGGVICESATEMK